MTEQNPEPEELRDPPDVVQELLRDAVEMDDVEDPDLGDVEVGPGEIVGVVDGVEIRHLVDESDHVLPIEDASGDLIGKNSFPEVADRPTDDASDVGPGGGT